MFQNAGLLSKTICTFTNFLQICQLRATFTFSPLFLILSQLSGCEQQGLNEGEGNQLCGKWLLLCHRRKQASQNILIAQFWIFHFTLNLSRHVKFWYLEYSRSAKYKEPVPLMGRCVSPFHHHHPLCPGYDFRHNHPLSGRPFLASRGTTTSVMWLVAGERWWVLSITHKHIWGHITWALLLQTSPTIWYVTCSLSHIIRTNRLMTCKIAILPMQNVFAKHSAWRSKILCKISS